MKIKTDYARMIDRAHTHLSPRATYGHNVLDGWQRWSGSDLGRKARMWGSYYWTRCAATAALAEAGGECVYDLSQNGRKIAALPVHSRRALDGRDITAVWQTADGYVARVDKSPEPKIMSETDVRPATQVCFRNGTLVSYVT